MEVDGAREVRVGGPLHPNIPNLLPAVVSYKQTRLALWTTRIYVIV